MSSRTSLPAPPVGSGPAAVGRDAVAAALVDAAAEELAERGFAATSVRAVARRAGVNHGLVHRHFGSKEALLGAVLDHLADEMADQLDLETGADAGVRSSPELDRFLRVLARALLDGVDVGSVRARHPVVERILPVVMARSGLAEADARSLVAERIALQLGWLLFEPFLADAAGLDAAGVAATRQRVAEAVRVR